MGFGMKTCRVIWRVLRGLRICALSPLNFWKSRAMTCSPLRDRQWTYNLLVSPHHQQSSSPASATQSQIESVGPDSQAGYDHVIRLADSLVDLRLQGFVTQGKVDEIVVLWNNLSDHDKGTLIYPPHHRDRVLKGRFKVSHSKTNVIPGTESLKRCFLGEGGPAQWPSTSRVVEAICLALCRIYPAGQTIAGVRVNRWAAILRDYRMIRDIVLGSPGIIAQTKLKLFELNQLHLPGTMPE